MSLTEAGSIYHERIVRTLDDLEEADSLLGPMQQEPKGLLRVSAPVTLTLITISPRIPGFLGRYPDLQLDLHMDDRRVNIIEDGFDIALRGSDNLEDSSLIARKLMHLRHVVCATPAYFARFGLPTRPEDLRSHNCIQFTLSGHASEWEFHNAARAVSVPINGRYKVASSLAVRDALCEGFGLSLIPRIYVENEIKRGQLVTVLDDWTTVQTTMYAVYPSRQYVVAKVRAFLDFLVSELNDDRYGSA